MKRILSVLIAAILIIALAGCVPVCLPGGNEGAVEEIQVSMSDGIYQPGFTVLPEDAINKKIAWSVSDEELASVDEEGCVVLLAPGDVTLTATLHSGKTISCLIHIGEAEEE